MAAALVTGAARRVGRTIALALAQAGYDVAVHHRSSPGEADGVCREIQAGGRRALPRQADLGDLEATSSLPSRAEAALSPLTLLVNCASVFQDDRFSDLDADGWDLHFATNLRAPVVLAEAFAAALPASVPDGEAAIVNIVDQRVLKPNPQFFSYALSKAALWNATRMMAQALAPRIRVNAVGPGPTLASIHQNLPGDLSADKAIYNYVKAIGKGLSKIMSKMGVSTYMSYCGAQLFEAIGLNTETVQKYFTGTASRVEGIGVFEIAEEALRRHRGAFGSDPIMTDMLDAGGEYAWRTRGEEHMWSPDAIAKLQHSTRANNWSTYKEYAQLINDQSKRHMTLRGLFEFKVDPAKAIPVDEVEPAKEIVKRFATGAMSLGSISTEAHATLAVAMEPVL